MPSAGSPGDATVSSRRAFMNKERAASECSVGLGELTHVHLAGRGEEGRGGGAGWTMLHVVLAPTSPNLYDADSGREDGLQRLERLRVLGSCSHNQGAAKSDRIRRGGIW